MSPSAQSTLTSKIHDRSARVAILGLGYVGLPLATVFAEAGFSVTGIDLDQDKVSTIHRGKSYIQDVSDDQVSRLVSSGNLEATIDFSALKDVDAVCVCVPTPLRKTGDPDLSYILDATDELAKYLQTLRLEKIFSWLSHQNGLTLDAKIGLPSTLQKS
jgi:UDP-N-acetyl-D-glucosamine dehydrogenase